MAKITCDYSVTFPEGKTPAESVTHAFNEKNGFSRLSVNMPTKGKILFEFDNRAQKEDFLSSIDQEAHPFLYEALRTAIGSTDDDPVFRYSFECNLFTMNMLMTDICALAGSKQRIEVTINPPKTNLPENQITNAFFGWMRASANGTLQEHDLS